MTPKRRVRPVTAPPERRHRDVVVEVDEDEGLDGEELGRRGEASEGFFRYDGDEWQEPT